MIMTIASTARPRLLVSIVNWNNTEVTNHCLASFLNIGSAKRPDIVVSDNGSSGKPFSINNDLSKKLVGTKVFFNSDNLGFAGAHNLVIDYASKNGYDFVALLNNDTEIIDTEVFDKLLAALESDDSAVGANPTILSSVNPDYVWYGGGKLNPNLASGQHLKVGEVFDPKNPGSIERVSFLTGCLLMIKLKGSPGVAQKLDESYFLYWEDADWCAKALNSHGHLLYVPGASLLHHTSSSLGVRSADYAYYNIRNKLLFMKRNTPWPYKPLATAHSIFIALKYLGLAILKPSSKTGSIVSTVFVAFVDGLRNVTGEYKRGHE